MLRTLNPLARGIDLAICLDCCNNRAGGHVHIPGSFDDAPQGCSDIALPLCKQTDGMRVPVDTGTIRKAVIRGNSYRATPRNEIRLNLFTLSVGADGAIALVPAHIHGFLLSGFTLQILRLSRSSQLAEVLR